jgi:cytochrome c2
MKKLVMTLFAVVVAGSTLLGLYVGTAQSRPQYMKAFNTMYVKSDGTPEQKALDDAIKGLGERKGCLVCHEGEKKSNRNAYGKELAKILKPADAPPEFRGETDKGKIEDALKKVADIHTDPKDDKSPTYGDLIKAGKLPGGEPKAGK